jgi:endonuclease/exonuclease/phosphatase family metal-dependent hydrolase
MKIKYALCIALMFVINAVAMAQQFTVGSFNVRNDNPGDLGNLWSQRKEVVANLLRFHKFDVFGTQEGKKNQIDDLCQLLPEYAQYGRGRDDGRSAGEHSSIFYKRDKFKLLDKGDFWLSEKPDQPGLGWDATCCNRICSWVYLQDVKSGKKFYFFNAHYDHEGKVARLESSKLVLKKIKEIAKNAPVIFTGDLNGNHQSEWYLALKDGGLLVDTYNQVKFPYINNSSFNGWGKQLDGNEIIDHVFVSKHFQAKRWGLLTDTYRGKFVSDHFPVLVDLEMN